MFTTSCAGCGRRYYSAAPENLKWCDRCSGPLEPIDDSAPLLDPDDDLSALPLARDEFLKAAPFQPKKLPPVPYKWQ